MFRVEEAEEDVLPEDFVLRVHPDVLVLFTLHFLTAHGRAVSRMLKIIDVAAYPG